MSNNASISAAKRRRGGAPPPMSSTQPPGTQGVMNLPPGLPPNFRQLPPQIQQQMLRQIQQRGPPPSAIPHPSSSSANIPVPVNKVIGGQNVMGGSGVISGGVGAIGASNGPYMVNSVLHNRATLEVSGLHIRDLPMTSSGLPCLPSGAALPPNVLFKLHHDELLNQDATLNDYSNRLQMLTNRVDRIEKTGGKSGGDGVGAVGDEMQGNYDNIVEDTNFIGKVVDNILTNTNLSDIINQIEPLQKENDNLRALLNSQQTTLNELSGLVMKLLNNGLPTYVSSNANGCDYLNPNAGDVAEYSSEYNSDHVTNETSNGLEKADEGGEEGGQEGQVEAEVEGEEVEADNDEVES
jgi:hypothetical protein